MKDRILGIADRVLMGVNVLNWLFVGVFALALILSFPFAPTILAQLAIKYSAQPLGPILNLLRGMCLFGVIAGVPLHVIFSRLRAIVATVGQGDPFVAENARRLQAVGWAVLVIQLLDLCLGAMTLWMTSRHIDTVGWSPSFGGWLSVLMIFVLARVFTIGTRMRDDLEMTV